MRSKKEVGKYIGREDDIKEGGNRDIEGGTWIGRNRSMENKKGRFVVGTALERWENCRNMRREK